MKAYHYFPFESNPAGHGGEKRAFQISEFLKKEGLELLPLNLNCVKSDTRIGMAISLFKNHSLIRNLGIKVKSVHHYRVVSGMINNAKQQIETIEPGSLLVYEHSVVLNWFVPILLKRKGLKILAIPHNLETLVPNQRSKLSHLPNPYGFFEEMDVLKTAGITLTISREEEWFLNLFNINAYYFPYFPDELETRILKEINRDRGHLKRNNHFLIFGSVGNPPSRHGMLELLSILNTPKTSSYTFHITGFGTDKMSDLPVHPDRFIYYGEVGTSKLHELYRDVDAVIIHQKPTTGSLIKIPELLIAGVPIIANSFAARSFYNLNGVNVYRSIDELMDYLSGEAPIIKSEGYFPNFNFKTLSKIIQDYIESP